MKEKNVYLRGKVVHGRGIGKLVGSPTANLEVSTKDNIPMPGVYISSVFWNEKTYYSITHIGKRPTIDNDESISVEVHILNFNQDIYGENLLVRLYTKLREPQKFGDLSALLDQIRRDCIATRKFFGLNDSPLTLCMDIEKHRVSVENRDVFLSTKEFDILYFLARNRGEVFTKEQIYQAVWESDYLLDDSNIMAFIRKLRKKIEPNPDAPQYILTIWGIGYKFSDKL